MLGGWEGQAHFKMSFPSGGAIELGQHLFKLATNGFFMTSRCCNVPLPHHAIPYTASVTKLSYSFSGSLGPEWRRVISCLPFSRNDERLQPTSARPPSLPICTHSAAEWILPASSSSSSPRWQHGLPLSGSCSRCAMQFTFARAHETHSKVFWGDEKLIPFGSDASVMAARYNMAAVSKVGSVHLRSLLLIPKENN